MKKSMGILLSLLFALSISDAGVAEKKNAFDFCNDFSARLTLLQTVILETPDIGHSEQKYAIVPLTDYSAENERYLCKLPAANIVVSMPNFEIEEASCLILELDAPQSEANATLNSSAMVYSALEYADSPDDIAMIAQPFDEFTSAVSECLNAVDNQKILEKENGTRISFLSGNYAYSLYTSRVNENGKTKHCLFMEAKSNHQNDASVPHMLSTSISKAESSPATKMLKHPYETMDVIYDYLVRHEQTEEYSISNPPRLEDSGEYHLNLVYDEEPASNGKADIIVKSGSRDVCILFRESDFFGYKLCAIPLIKSSVRSIVCALYQGADIDNKVDSVLLSFDENKYTYITYAGDYAFVFRPSSTYKVEFYAIYMPDYLNSYTTESYRPATHAQFSAQINNGSKYLITAKVRSIYPGAYRNSYFSYPCMMMTVEDSSGNTYTVAQHMHEVPLTFVEGETYTFYGRLIFDVPPMPILRLDYAE